MDQGLLFKPGDILCLQETATTIGNINLSMNTPEFIEKTKEKYRRWRFRVISLRENHYDTDGNTCLWLERLDLKSHPKDSWSPALVKMAPENEIKRNGEFIGSGMRASFIKEKVDLAHCRGFAVLIERVTPADNPDDKAVYNMYQVDANSVKAMIKTGPSAQ